MKKWWCISILSLFIACSGSTRIYKSGCTALRLDRNEFVQAKVEGLEVLSAKVEEDCLKLEFRVKNACPDDAFYLHWNYMVKKSMPPIARMKISQKSSGSANCNKRLIFEQAFQLKELMNPAYKGKVIIDLLGYEEKSNSTTEHEHFN